MNNIPDRVSNFSNNMGNLVNNVSAKVSNYVGGESAQKLDDRMKLFPGPPIPAKDTGEISLSSKVLNGVFGVTVAPLTAIARAPVAAYKTILANNKQKLREKELIGEMKAGIKAYEPGVRAYTPGTETYEGVTKLLIGEYQRINFIESQLNRFDSEISECLELNTPESNDKIEILRQQIEDGTKELKTATGSANGLQKLREEMKGNLSAKLNELEKISPDFADEFSGQVERQDRRLQEYFKRNMDI